jgi:hypothetical protein
MTEKAIQTPPARKRAYAANIASLTNATQRLRIQTRLGPARILSERAGVEISGRTQLLGRRISTPLSATPPPNTGLYPVVFSYINRKAPLWNAFRFLPPQRAAQYRHALVSVSSAHRPVSRQPWGCVRVRLPSNIIFLTLLSLIMWKIHIEKENDSVAKLSMLSPNMEL